MKLKRKVRRLEQGITMLRGDMSRKLSRIEGLLKVFMKDVGVDVPQDYVETSISAFRKMMDGIEPPLLLPKAMPEVSGETIRFRRPQPFGIEEVGAIAQEAWDNIKPSTNVVVEGITPTPEAIKDFNDDILCQCPYCRKVRDDDRVGQATTEEIDAMDKRLMEEEVFGTPDDVAASLIDFPDDPVMWPEDCQVFIVIDPGVEDWSGIAMVRDKPDDAMIDAMAFGTGLLRARDMGDVVKGFGPAKVGTYFSLWATESTIMKALKEMNE